MMCRMSDVTSLGHITDNTRAAWKVVRGMDAPRLVYVRGNIMTVTMTVILTSWQ